MITLNEHNDKLLFVYSFDPYYRTGDFFDWIKDKGESHFIFKSLSLSKENIYITNTENIEKGAGAKDGFSDEEYEVLKKLADRHGIILDDEYGDELVLYAFVVGSKTNGIYYLDKEIFDLSYNFGYHENLNFNEEHLYFQLSNYKYKNIPKAIISVVEQDFIISDIEIENTNVVPIDVFNKIVNDMPNKYHFQSYYDSKIEEIIQEHLEIRNSKIEKFENYLKKKKEVKQYSSQIINEYEIVKYESVLSEIKEMLEDEYISEVAWQEKLLEILPLIYPEYVCFLKEVEFSVENNKSRRIDYLLVDANGYVRVAELKRPYKQGFISNSKYRDNHYVVRELSGSIMQVEKYIYYLTRNSRNEEKIISNKYKDELLGINIKIVNPKGLIIAGRSNEFTNEQRLDFEIIKNKYRNIAEIVTYDDLLERLENIIKFSKSRI